MGTKTKISITLKALYSIVVLGIFLATLGAGNISSVYAQGASVEALTNVAPQKLSVIPTEITKIPTIIPTVATVKTAVQMQTAISNPPETPMSFVGGKSKNLQQEIASVQSLEFLYLPFQIPSGQPTYYLDKMTSVFDHSSPNYTKADKKIIMFNSGIFDDLCISKDYQGVVVPNCVGAIQSFMDIEDEYGERIYYNGHNGYDWGVSGNVEAAASGTVESVGWSQESSYKCLGYSVIINHKNGYRTIYGHLKDKSSPLKEGEPISVGSKIGEVGTTTLCGTSTGPHLHFQVEQYTFGGWMVTDPFGWASTQDDPLFLFNGVRSQNLWVGFAPKPYGYTGYVSPPSVPNNGAFMGGAIIVDAPQIACPQSGDVIFYYNADYDCYGLTEGSGFIRRENSGWQNMTANMDDKASSVKIPFGWSVMLYENPNRGLGNKCLNSGQYGTSDFNFLGKFDGSNISVNDRTSSFEVFTTSNCGVAAPTLPPTTVPPPTPPPPTPSPSDGIEVCDQQGFGLPCKTYTYISEDYCIVLANDSLDGMIESIRVKGIYAGQYEAILFDDNHCGTSFGRYGNQHTNLGAYNNVTSSLKIHKFPLPKPDLIPATAAGRPSPVIISTSPNTTINSTLYAGEPIYIDLGFKNQGSLDAGQFNVELWIGNELLDNWLEPGQQAGITNEKIDWGEIWDTPGTFTITVKVDPDSAVDESDEGNNIWTGQFTWLPRGPGQFGKGTPVNSAPDLPTSVSLSWNSSTDASAYEYCVDTTDNSLCDSPWQSTGVFTSTTVSSLLTNTTYYWQVRAISSGQTTYADNSTWWSFKTQADPPGTFSKKYPDNGLTGFDKHSISNYIIWWLSAGADSYEYCIDTTDNNSCDGENWLLANPSLMSIEDAGANLQFSNIYGTTYYWQMRAKNIAGGIRYADNGAWWNFTVEPAPAAPAPFEKISPAHNATVSPDGLILSWMESLGATHYYYCLDQTNDDMCDNRDFHRGTTIGILFGNYSPDNPTYYYQVWAANEDGVEIAADNGAWSTITIQYPPEPTAIPTPTTPPSSDLIVTNLSYLPAAPEEGQLVTFTIDIMNQGAGAMEMPSYIDLYIDNSPTGCMDWTSETYFLSSILGPGETQQFLYVYSGFTSSGIHAVSTFVDSGCNILESDENNNIYNLANINVVPGNPPDLIPFPLFGRDYPVVASNAYDTVLSDVLYSGTPTYLDWGFKNNSNVPIASNFYVDIYIDNQLYVHYPFNYLAASQTMGFEDWQEVWYQPGWHSIKMVVDPENLITESDENNNEWMQLFYWEIVPNDEFVSPSIINLEAYSNTQSSLGASTSLDDPIFDTACVYGGDQKYNTVWYKYVAATNGFIQIDTFGSDYDTVLAVWTGTRDNLQNQICNDDGSGSLQSQVQMPVTSGVTYYIEIASYYSLSGNLSLSLNKIYPPLSPSFIIPGNGSNNTNDTNLNFGWLSSPGATEYLIEWWGGPYSTMQPCGWTTLTSCYIGTVWPGYTYSWHVKARNMAGESNWSDTWTFTVQSNALPDLVVQSITASPSSPSMNQAVSFTVRVKNQGAAAISSNFYVDLFIDAQPGSCPTDGITYWTINSLAAGATQDLTYNYAGFSSAGAHNLYAFADSYCSISESNDSNNILGPIALNVQQPQAPPTVVSSMRANTNPTAATNVNFTVTFSESVTGVNIAAPFNDFALTTSPGITGAFVAGVTPISGTTYIVSVNTGSGNGTIRLDVMDNNSIVDAASNPLGGAAMGDGNFTTGEVYTITKSAGGDTTGVFRPGNGLLYLKNANTTGFADVAINYGTGGDYPVAGDWDGNGTATIGIYRNGIFYLRNSNTLGFADIVFAFGTPGDQPVAGDWDGDGVDTIGVYSNGQFLLRNSNSAGTADMSFYLGNPGDVGIAGDWNGDGSDTTGVFRPSNGIIFLKNANTTGFADIALNYGLAGDMPVTGDWNNDGIDTIGVYRNAQFMLRNSNTIGFAEIVFALGNPGDMPISGNWDGIP